MNQDTVREDATVDFEIEAFENTDVTNAPMTVRC